MSGEMKKSCACHHSLAVVCALFATLAAAAWLAQDACLDRGGRLGEVAWSCEASTGALTSLWLFVTPGMAALALLVGIPVYLAVRRIVTAVMPVP